MLNLITNRTQADVDLFLKVRAKITAAGWSALKVSEKAVWMDTKGEYRFSDLNRVGSAVRYLASLLGLYGYPVSVSVRTSWIRSDIPSSDVLQAYLADILAL